RFRFGAAGHNLHSQVMGERDDGVENNRPFAGSIRPDKRRIDLNRVERKSLQISQGQTAGAKIVNRKSGAQGMYTRQDLRRKFWIFHDEPGGKFKLEGARDDT